MYIRYNAITVHVLSPQTVEIIVVQNENTFKDITQSTQDSI